jgi:bacteriorhodopsin
MSSTKPVANPEDAFLSPNDGVAISFWIISIAMIAATFFFFAEASTVDSHWKTSLHVGGLVTLVAAVHYMYMREYWVQVHKSPIVYRYVDWSITVPLQMIEFNLILKAAGKPTGSGMFWRLLLGTVMMLAFGYAGEIRALPAWPAFAGGMCGWGFILQEIFMGEAGGTAAGCSPAVATSFSNMRLIVTVGWSIYPLGYLFGYLLGAVDDVFLNVIYNIADLLNKIGFVLSCWSCAKEDNPQWMALSELLYRPAGKASGAASSFDQAALTEAATKLIGNHDYVVKDICNASPISQRDLRRVSAGSMPEVDQMMQEVAGRLLGRRGLTCGSATHRDAAAYLASRTQSTAQQCPGRNADMSEQAAAAFLAVVKEVGSGA